MPYEIKDDFAQNRLHAIAENIKPFVPSGWGFTLFLFSYGEGGNLFYISTVDREDGIRIVEEWLKNQRGEPQ